MLVTNLPSRADGLCPPLPFSLPLSLPLSCIKLPQGISVDTASEASIIVGMGIYCRIRGSVLYILIIYSSALDSSHMTERPCMILHIIRFRLMPSCNRWATPFYLRRSQQVYG